MSQHAEPITHAPPIHYIIVWAVLVVLFVGSVGFSFVSSFIVGVVFAFFIAIVKAVMVGAWFMHLNLEPKWVWIMFAGGLMVVFIMWLGIAPDVMEMRGLNWEKIPASAFPK